MSNSCPIIEPLYSEVGIRLVIGINSTAFSKTRISYLRVHCELKTKSSVCSISHWIGLNQNWSYIEGVFVAFKFRLQPIRSKQRTTWLKIGWVTRLFKRLCHSHNQTKDKDKQTIFDCRGFKSQSIQIIVWNLKNWKVRKLCSWLN